MSPSESAVSALPSFVATALRPLPLLPLQPVLAQVFRRITSRHPGLFARLGEHGSKRFGIAPTDLPFAFILAPGGRHPSIRAVRQLPEQGLDSRISGTLSVLLGLVRGDYDGDALFFSRDLRIEGDMAAVLALRNAIDDAQIDVLREAIGGLGPLGWPLQQILNHFSPPSPAPEEEPFVRGERKAWN